MRDTYRQIDEQVGKVMSAVGENTAIVVMSDHGFSSFRRQVHLNRWLEQHGYLRLTDSFNRDKYEWLQGIDWSATRAFAIGLNSLYLNVRGREKRGIVSPKQRAALAAKLAQELGAWVDEENGQKVVTQVTLREQVYHGPFVDAAPDIIVGYAPGYRASWDTTTGKIPLALIEPNIDEWTGDHCIDSRAVPGVLLSNRPLRARSGGLADLTVSVLGYFGVAPAAGMNGKPHVLKGSEAAREIRYECRCSATRRSVSTRSCGSASSASPRSPAIPAPTSSSRTCWRRSWPD